MAVISYTFPKSGHVPGEVDFQKRWYHRPYHFIDTNLLARPSVTLIPTHNVAVLEDRSGKPGTKIYYTLDGSDPRGPKGTTNVLAREYRRPNSAPENGPTSAREP
jgi:hypothetical protein